MDKRSPRLDSSQGSVMHYLGRLSGNGALRCNGVHIARASYDFDGFVTKPLGVTCCGEIQLSAAILKDVFGRRDVQLLTDGGRLLDLRFSEKALRSASDVAHVDVTGELPATPQSWRNEPPDQR
ncbi:hypothetical protein HPT29_024970 (plasmid) [Microvirga terrae]|uniref:Uncharacterized protein n=1 Tax=Microvirga terrae TaxID=2740529 RepID=A0ABY5RYS1_9HYPH|nr:hypothetical protein [Microvirga terrae]UVF22413.1 hypothetical protein HPT29_024970 [Microvirga terrae]